MVGHNKLSKDEQCFLIENKAEDHIASHVI